MFDLLSIAIIVLVVYLFLNVYIVPPRRMALVERLGRFHRELLPGMHLVFRPFETLRTVEWTKATQSGQKVKWSGQYVSFENCQLDIPPLKCITTDMIQAQVDVTVMYTITSLSKAVYHTDDIMDLFFQTLNQHITTYTRNMSSLQLRDGSAIEFMKECRDQVTEAMLPRGIRCNDIIIQGVVMDQKMESTNQEIHVRQQQALMRKREQEAEHERKMAELEFMEAEAKTKNRIALEEAKSKAEQDRHGIQIALEREQVKLKAYKEMGMSPEQVVQLMQADALTKNTKKVVLAPLEHWTSGMGWIKKMN